MAQPGSGVPFRLPMIGQSNPIGVFDPSKVALRKTATSDGDSGASDGIVLDLFSPSRNITFPLPCVLPLTSYLSLCLCLSLRLSLSLVLSSGAMNISTSHLEYESPAAFQRRATISVLPRNSLLLLLFLLPSSLPSPSPSPSPSSFVIHVNRAIV